MGSDLTSQESQYINKIMEILRSNGVNSSYRKDAKIQLIEHMQESRLHNEDFRTDLGSPQEFSLHFMDTAVSKENHSVNYKEHLGGDSDMNKKTLSFKMPLLFILFAGLYYVGLQFMCILLFTTALTPGIETDFNLFVLSDYFWWNMMITVVNIFIGFLLSSISMKLLSKRYHLS